MGELVLIRIERQFQGGKGWMNNGLYLSKALKVISNRYLLVKIISDRVQQLNKGAKPLVDIDESPSLSLTEIACKEIVQGKLNLEKPPQEPKNIKKKKATQDM
jgi:DNA-directed RNA polymerase subunit omega